jgi:signal transduction histidine kinase
VFWQVTAVALVVLAVLLGSWLVHLKVQIYRLAVQVREIRTTGSRSAVSVTLVDPQLDDLAAETEELRLLLRENRAEVRRIRVTAENQLCNVVHDLRTPLVALRGFLQLARRTSAGDGAERDAHLAIAESKVDLIAKYIVDFLDFATIERGDFITAIEPVDVVAVLGEVIADCVNAWSEPAHELTVDIPDGAVMVLADREALRRIMQNLVANALQHASGPANVALSDGAEPRLTVANEAANLRHDDVGLLLLRGYRADRTRAGSHAGVGLAIVAALVERMPVTFSAGLEGARFQVTLDLTSAAPQVRHGTTDQARNR